MGVFLLVISLVAIGYQPPERTNGPVANAVTTPSVATGAKISQTSVDQMVATSVAAGIAERAELPVATNLANLSLSLAAESRLAQNDANVISKPQIVKPTADDRTIRTYKAVAGDTVGKVANKFGVNTETVRWANDLSSDALTSGQTLKIPSSDGVLHVVKSGDTAKSLARKYGVQEAVVVAYNDLEGVSRLSVGRQIFIPKGVISNSERSGTSTSSQGTAAYNGINGSYSGGYGIDSNIAQASAGNRYAFGNCTWYAYERRVQLGLSVGSFWGNANTWAAYASSAGYKVNGTPGVGSIMQNGGGYGHVAIVEKVVPGKYIVISEMNGYRFGGGFNRIGTGNIPWSDATSGYYRYIH